MGVTDEHWCSKCKRALDKEKEEYLELTALNDPDVLGMPCTVNGTVPDPNKPSKVERFAKGLMCEACARKVKVSVDGGRKRTSLWVFFKELRKKGNPTFDAFVGCKAFQVCETFEPPDAVVAHLTDLNLRPKPWLEGSTLPPGEGVVAMARACAHCAVDVDGRLYCKRRHPGGLALPQEKAVFDEARRQMVGEYLLNFLRESPALQGLLGGASPAGTPWDKSEAMTKFCRLIGLDPKNLHNPEPERTGADIGGVKPLDKCLSPWEVMVSEDVCRFCSHWEAERNAEEARTIPRDENRWCDQFDVAPAPGTVCNAYQAATWKEHLTSDEIHDMENQVEKLKEESGEDCADE